MIWICYVLEIKICMDLKFQQGRHEHMYHTFLHVLKKINKKF